MNFFRKQEIVQSSVRHDRQELSKSAIILIFKLLKNFKFQKFYDFFFALLGVCMSSKTVQVSNSWITLIKRREMGTGNSILQLLSFSVYKGKTFFYVGLGWGFF